FWARTTSPANVKQFLRTHVWGGEVLDRFLPLLGGLLALAVSRFSLEGALMGLAITASLTLFSRTRVREIALRQWSALGPSRSGSCELSVLGAMRTSETICFDEHGAVFVGGYDLVAKSVSNKQVEGEIRAMLEETSHPLKSILTHEMTSLARIRVLSSPANVSGLIHAKTEDGLPILFGARESLLAQGVGTASYEPFVRENDLPGAEVWFAAKNGDAIACFIVRRRLAAGLRTAIARVQEAGLEAAMRSSVSPEMGEALGFERVLPEGGEDDERTISIERPSSERASVRRSKRVVLGGSVDAEEACVVDSDSPLDAVNVTLAILRAAKLDHLLALVGTFTTLFALLLAFAGLVSPFGFLAAMVLGQCAQFGILVGLAAPGNRGGNSSGRASLSSGTDFGA
ncbi:MAG: hypothetical protein KBF88_16945, partial [Polyangiaceae bacterium]|nr:hypothetical protein [Polyangiaceae bacterium]